MREFAAVFIYIKPWGVFFFSLFQSNLQSVYPFFALNEYFSRTAWPNIFVMKMPSNSWASFDIRKCSLLQLKRNYLKQPLFQVTYIQKV